MARAVAVQTKTMTAPRDPTFRSRPESDRSLFAVPTLAVHAAAGPTRREAHWPQRLLRGIAQGRLDWATGGRAPSDMS